jgi:hypothetical protein
MLTLINFIQTYMSMFKTLSLIGALSVLSPLFKGESPILSQEHIYNFIY